MRLLVALALLIVPTALAQDYVPRDERGSLDARTQAELDGNRVHTSAFNFGQSGRTGASPGMVPYEWPAESRQHYVALTGLFVGAEVQSAAGQTVAIVNVPNYRENQPDPDEAWTWAPVPEYLGGGEVARSDRPETWPAVWPDKLGDADDPGWSGAWNGLLGKDAVIDGVELFAHYSDDGYSRNREAASTSYYPDSTDLDRAGLGLVVSERRLAFREPSVEDAVFAVRDIWNAGTEDLAGVGATVWLADLVGGDADGGDDEPVFFQDAAVVVFADEDGLSSDPAFPAGQTVGAAALVLLEDPVGLGFTTVRHVLAGGVNYQSVPDAWLFEELMVPAAYAPFTPTGQDYDTFASVGLFEIPAGTSVRFATAVVLGEVDYDVTDPALRFADVLQKAEQARSFYAAGFAVAEESGAASPGLELRASPNPASGTVRLTFRLAAPQPVEVDVLDALGRRVARLADRPFAAGPHTLEWDARGQGAGVYLVRVRTEEAVHAQRVTRLR